MCHLHEDALVNSLFRCMKNADSADFGHDAICMLHWTGRKVQRVHGKGQPDAMWRAQEGGNWAVCRVVLGACLFYKQWKQISIGARLPQPYGEDVLCGRRLLTNHCVGHTVTGIISGHR